MAREASPVVTTGGRSLREVRSVNLRSMARPARAEAPRVVNRLPRPSEIWSRVPFSTASPTERVRRSYASILRSAVGILLRSRVRPIRRTRARSSKPMEIRSVQPGAIMDSVLRVDNGQRLVILDLVRAYGPVSQVVFRPEKAD